MDKYLMIMMIFFIAGAGIGITRDPPQHLLFWAMIGGAITIVIYNAMKTRKEQNEIRRRKRKSKK